MSEKTKNILFQIIIPAAVTTFFVVAMVYAWTSPTASPPQGNVAAPINVGDASQYKSGALGIGGLLRGYSNAIFDGNVGIGTTNPGAKLEVAGRIKAQTPIDSNDVATKGYVDAQSGSTYIVTTRAQYSASYPSPYCPGGWTYVTAWNFCTTFPANSCGNKWTQTLCKR